MMRENKGNRTYREYMLKVHLLSSSCLEPKGSQLIRVITVYTWKN